MKVQLNSSSVLDAGKLESVIIVQRWQHYRNVASRYSTISTVSSTLSNLKLFLPASISNYVEYLLNTGNLDNILFLLDRNITLQFNQSFDQIYAMIPSNVKSSILISFTQRLLSLVQKQQYICHSLINNVHDAAQEDAQLYLPIIRELFDRADDMALNETCGPSECLSIVLYNIGLIDSLSDITNQEVGNIREALIHMERNLRLQLVARDVLHIDVAYEEVKHEGLSGIIFERFYNLPECDLRQFIEDKIKFVVMSFEKSLDDIITTWLDETLESCLIVSGAEKNEDDED